MGALLWTSFEDTFLFFLFPLNNSNPFYTNIITWLPYTRPQSTQLDRYVHNSKEREEERKEKECLVQHLMGFASFFRFPTDIHAVQHLSVVHSHLFVYTTHIEYEWVYKEFGWLYRL